MLRKREAKRRKRIMGRKFDSPVTRPKNMAERVNMGRKKGEYRIPEFKAREANNYNS